MQNKKIKVLMTAAEMSPFAKVGGLGDVVGSLPGALEKINIDVRVILPLYGAIDHKKFRLKKILENIEIASNSQTEKINLWKTNSPSGKVSVYFLESKYFQAKEIYRPEENDNLAESFLFFSLAVLKILPLIRFQPDIIHCHDFHTALIPALLKEQKLDIKTVYTIHNLNYQGNNTPLVLRVANLNIDDLASLKKDAQDGDINFMVQGILNADVVTTVSKTYAKEIGTVEFGVGLEKIITQKKIYGIINGLDVELFNPATDKFIAQTYSNKNLGDKQKNKTVLQKKLGLKVDKDVPLIGMVTRLTWQKGFDLFNDNLFQLPLQMIILGTGEVKYENKLNELAKKYPDNFKFENHFDLKLAQQIYAGSDMFLMPSRFEPCGLGQMIAMSYGTIPIVRATGGLDDTVNDRVGFKFKEFSEKVLIRTLEEAIKKFADKKQWQRLQKNCMQQDFSWGRSAKEYVKIYKELIIK